MNNSQRDQLDLISTGLAQQLEILSEFLEDLELLREEEQEKFDNLSEGLQVSEKGQTIEQAADELDTACQDLQSTSDSLQSAIDAIGNAIGG